MIHELDRLYPKRHIMIFPIRRIVREDLLLLGLLGSVAVVLVNVPVMKLVS